MKICSRCKQEKSYTEFGKSKQTKDGFKFHCYECRNNDYKNRIKPGHPNFIGPIIPENLRLCPDCSQFNTLNDVETGKDKHNKITYHNQCKKCRLKYVTDLRHKSPEKYKIALKKYRQSPKGKQTKKLYKQKLKIKVHNIIREEIRSLVRKRRMNKSDTTCAYLGCNDGFFIKHIETQFESWMNWDNHGPGYLLNKRGKPIYDKNGLTIPIKQWNFDHINPCENFDLENDPNEAYKCFHYTNYRPLLAKKNSEKGDLLPDGTRARNRYKTKQKLPIFINKSQWSTFTPEQMTEFENDIFNYYKSTGFPYFNLSQEEKRNIFNKLIVFNSSTLLKEDNILSQNMLGLNLANNYMSHIWETRSGNFMTPMEVFQDDNKFRAAIKKRINIGDNISDAGIRKILSMYSGAHKVSNFRPTIAKYIYDTYSGAGNVLDFSCGFGGRLLGALSSNEVKIYNGFEPNQKTFNELCKISQDFNVKATNIQKLPFEDSDCKNDYFNLIFSSPPYFNTEKYSDEPTQSYLRYPAKELWKEKFLSVLIQKSLNYLKSGGYFIINIANVKNYPNLEQNTLELAQNTGFRLIKTYKMVLSALMKSGFKYEPIFVFQK